MAGDKYPEFRNPDKYMSERVNGSPLGRMKRRTEQAALDRCLDEIGAVDSICDVPSGPGRLFPYWNERGVRRVHGVDVSGPMVEASREEHARLGLQGDAGPGDAFHLGEHLEEPVDVVASVRFIYYFDRARRVELLRSLASASRRWVLVQYKTNETLKGSQNQVREHSAGGRRSFLRHFGSRDEIFTEIREAGLIPVRFEPIGEFSDRAFVLARKPYADETIPLSVRQRPQRVRAALTRWAVALLFIAVLVGVHAINMDDLEIITRKEANVALGALSVLQGHWLVPDVPGMNAAPRAPLPYWFAAGTALAIDDRDEEFSRAANLTVAGVVLIALFAFLSARWGAWSALMGLVVLGTSYVFWDRMTGISPEMPTLACLVVSWSGLYGLLTGQFRWGRWLRLWGGLGLALLSGGVEPGLMTFVLIAIAIFVPTGRLYARSVLARLRPLSGIALALAPFALWLVLVALLDSRAVAFDIVRQNAHAIFRHGLGWRDTVVPLLLAMMPWTFVILWRVWETLRKQWRHIRRRRERRKDAPAAPTVALARRSSLHTFSLIAVLVVLAFGALPSTGIDDYLLLAAPWAAALLGDALWRGLASLAPPSAHKRHAGARQFAGVMLGLKQGRVVLASAALLLVGVLAMSEYSEEWVQPRESARPAARMLDGDVEGDKDALLVFRDTDPRLVFYLDDPYHVVEGDAAGLRAIETATAADKEMFLLIGRNDLPKIASLHNRTALNVRRRFSLDGTDYVLFSNRRSQAR